MRTVEVRFLGSGDAFGSGGRFQTCIAVRGPGRHFLIDCGATSLVAAKSAGIDPGTVDLVLISHLHGDHFGGLPFLLVHEAAISKRTRALTVAGPRGLRERLRRALDVFFPGVSESELPFPVRLEELAPRKRHELEGVAVTGFPVVHFPGTEPLALRVELEGRIVTYSGDTGWTPALVEAAAGADLFICEAYAYDGGSRFHLDYRTLMAHRGELTCERLVLTHPGEELLALRDSLDADVADDGTRIRL